MPATLSEPPSGLRRYVPALDWLTRYDTRRDFRGDLTAGLTTAVMLIPQAMAYAMLAGLPPIVGLYASLLPLAVYALLGTSRQLAVGPVAMVSLLVAQGVAPLAEQGSEAFLTYAVLLAFMVGALQLAMGLLRLGFLVNFLSHPVISGFTSAAALIIGFSQLGHLLGIEIPRGGVGDTLRSAVDQIDAWDWTTLGISLGAVVVLLVAKKLSPRFPRALAVVVVGTLAVVVLGLDVRVVGEVPAGLPGLSMPRLETQAMSTLLPIALTIALVSFMESISVAKAFARRHHYEVDANQELVALGAANLAGSVMSAYPVTGGFSRTAVNDQADARTPMAGLVTAGVVSLALLWLTPLFHSLPKAVLGAIIMVAVLGLVDVHEVKHLWKVKRSDLALLALTFFATLFVGIEEGILVGVGASLLHFIVRSTRPHCAVLGRRPDGRYLNVDRFADAEPTPGVLAVRLDAQLYFGNVGFLKERLVALELAAESPVHAVVLDAAGINQLDSSAVAALSDLRRDYEAREVRLIIAGPKGPVRDVMQRSGLWEALGETGRAEDVGGAMDRLEMPPPRRSPSSDAHVSSSLVP